jgi:hypothetical protein
MGLADALVAVAAAYSPDSSRSSPTFPEVLPVTFAKPDPGRPAKKQKVDRRRREHRPERQAMPPEYVKPEGKPGKLNPIWHKSFQDDEEDAKGRGKVVEGLAGYGVWRRVPGFWKILASDLGYIMTEGDLCVRTPTVNVDHYLVVGCNGTPERVHILVCRAFHGRPKPNELSVDHIGGNDLPMAERRQDNRSVNLRWATLEQQRRNRGEAKAHSNGEPCLVWEVKGGERKARNVSYDTTRVENTMEWFPSKSAAAQALGLDSGHLSNILNGKAKTVPATDGTRYTGEWDPDHTKLPGEKWKVCWRSEKEKKAGALRISNYGRIQWGYPGRWGHMHYPESSNADGYLRVKIDGKDKLVHVLVGELFFIGPKPRNWACWDHKDLDKQNNHISNLRPVTVEENGVNTARQRDFYLWPENNPDQWVRCVSQRATARAYCFFSTNLNDVLHKRPNKHGSVQKTVNGYCAAWCDEVDEI